MIAEGAIFREAGTLELPLHQTVGALLLTDSPQHDACRAATPGPAEPGCQKSPLNCIGRGRRFDFALLQAMVQHDENGLIRLVKELLAAQSGSRRI